MKPLRVLLLEDSAQDAELLKHALDSRHIDYEMYRVATEQEFVTSLTSLHPDLILADYTLPGFGGMEALAIRNERAPSTPFIFVSGSLGEERAVATLVSGATDYILKDRLTRLPAAMTRALQETRQRQEKEKIAAELEAERRMMRTIQDTAKALIIVLDAQGHILHLNPEAARVLDQPRLALIGAVFWTSCIAPEDVKATRHHLRITLKNSKKSGHVWRAGTRNSRTIMWSISSLDSSNWQGTRIVLCGIDVTDEESAVQKAYFLDNFDSVTGLPNRKCLLQQLQEHCLQAAQKPRHILALVMIGIPRFHEIRDSCGDAIMNQVLTVLVQRLRQSQQSSQLLAHVSDSGFAMTLEMADDNELTVQVPLLLELLRKPIEFEEKHFVLQAYGGTAVYLRDASEPLLLMQAAEAALHSAESSSEKGYAVYRSVLSQDARKRLQLESDLRRALQGDGEELILHYQPQVEIHSGKVTGLEALVRWQHPQLGLLRPEAFIPMAEVCGLMHEIGRQVLHKTCQQIQEWQQQGLQPPLVAMNVSASQFSSPDLLEQVDAALSAFGLTGSHIEIELTESASMKNPETTISIMTQLRKHHVTLSIDDFGTGYSNLSYLKRFPVDRLKLDQAFVREITEDADDLAIARSIITIAQQLQLEVIAEGVETIEQIRLLAKAGCHHVQGYYFSHPVPGVACERFLREHFTPPDITPLLTLPLSSATAE